MIIKTQKGVYTHSDWWQQAKVEDTKMSLWNPTKPPGMLLLLDSKVEGLPRRLFNDLAAALEQSRRLFDVSDWCKGTKQSSQGTKKQATKKATKEV